MNPQAFIGFLYIGFLSIAFLLDVVFVLGCSSSLNGFRGF